MSKYKALGMGLLAALAISAFAVVNASATTGGHFTSEATEHHLIIKGTESRVSGTHALSFNETNATTETTGNTAIQCTHAEYHGTLTGEAATTTQSVQVRPVYKECLTAGAASHNVTVDVPGTCGTNVFEFKSGHGGTVNVNCTITITHPNCTIVVPTGQKLSGITYDTDERNGKHSLTMTVNVQHITGNYHSGICVFLGTAHKFEMTGSVTVWGENSLGNPVGITHTAT
jgi:hypothetical protein